MTNFVIKICNDLEELAAASPAATQYLTRRNISSQAIFAANLAIEEIVSNVLKYGTMCEHEITIGLTLAENTLEIEISDEGSAFDTFNQPVANASHAARRIGGLRIHLIRNMLDDCEYK